MMNSYLVEELLYNKPYRSARGSGTIVEAVKRSDVWVSGEGYANAYSVRVRPTFDGITLSDFWATIAVEMGE